MTDPTDHAAAAPVPAGAGFAETIAKSYRADLARLAVTDSVRAWEADRREPAGPPAATPLSLLDELFANTRVRFWCCLIPGHDKNGGGPTVRWDRDVAHCLTPGCTRSSTEPQPEATP